MKIAFLLSISLLAGCFNVENYEICEQAKGRSCVIGESGSVYIDKIKNWEIGDWVFNGICRPGIIICNSKETNGPLNCENYSCDLEKLSKL